MKPLRLARLIFALAPLCLAALPASAQTPPPSQAVTLPPGAPPLTPVQQKKQQARLARFYQGLNVLKNNSRMTPAQKQQQFVTMRKTLDRDMLAILTPAQRKAVVQQNSTVLKLRQTFFKQHQGEITQANKLAAAYRRSLTPAQKKKIAVLEAQAKAQFVKLQGDTKMPPVVKQHTADAIMRDTRNQEVAVLTPTQRSEMQQVQSIQARFAQELAAYAKAHGQP